MAKKRFDAIPAPDGFWDELRGYHNELWHATAGKHRNRILAKFATDQWLRRDSENEGLGVAGIWQARRFIGGTIVGSVNVCRMRLADIEALTQHNDPPQAVMESNAPAENTRFMYVMEEGGKGKPILGYDTQLLTPREVAVVSLSRRAEWTVGMMLAMQSMQPSTEQQYDQVLAELAVGASGQYRVSPAS